MKLDLSAISALTTTVLACSSNDLNLAIDKFCHKKDSSGKATNDIVVPSDYAANGVKVGNFLVRIRGGCSPVQWVPADVCVKQFQDMCAQNWNNKEAFYTYKGGPRCQQWYYADLTKPSDYAEDYRPGHWGPVGLGS